MTRRFVQFCAASALAALAAAQPAAAQAYKCLDPAGKAIYSDRPCRDRGLAEQKVLPKAPPPGSSGEHRPPHARPAVAPDQERTPPASQRQRPDPVTGNYPS